jgi:signal transduction histidine kinase
MMRSASSLSNRIFLACTLLATLSLGFAFWVVNATATKEAEADLQRGLRDAAEQVNQLRTTTLTGTFTMVARVMANLPVVKAAVTTGDPPTVRPVVVDYRDEMKVDLLVVVDRQGKVLGSAGADGVTLPGPEGLPAAFEERAVFVPHSRGLLQLITVPILLGVEPSELLGQLTVGFFLDHDRVLQFKALTNSEIAFGAGDRILASSLPPESHDLLRGAMTAPGITSVTLGGEEYLALARPLDHRPAAAGAPAGHGPVVLVLRSRTARLAFLDTIRAGLVGALLIAVLLATIISFVVARTITRPLAAVTGAMGDVAATGDLTRRVPVRSRAWDDEDARLLAGAFNTLTESIARFRHEETQKDRLTSLGRLSTVIAHEIRNPLMIIRASLRTLGREHVAPSELREAVADIDEETARLNRIVTEVLDFAKPLRFEMADASLNDICRASVTAAWAGDGKADVELDLDPDAPAIVTDAERLRTAFVNILTNARYAVQAAVGAAPVKTLAEHGMGALVETAAPDVVALRSVMLRTRREQDRISVTISDAGIGIAAEDMAHIFDPYFTTRRAGTGLGLPISKTIIEGLGGTISVKSQRGEGTEIRIVLPLSPPGISA